MDSVHDLGGKQGFGPVLRERDEPVFHNRWEAAVFTFTRTARAAGALQNTDQFRFAVERIDPVAYLTHGYYGRWLGGLENLFIEAETFEAGALDARLLTLGGNPEDPVAARPNPGYAPFAAPIDAGAARPLSSKPLYMPGDEVVASSVLTAGHTRLPAYARGRRGTVVAWHQGWVYPDSNAHGMGERPQHLYTVAFTGEQLWGPESEASLLVHLDLFEPYLEFVDE